MKLLLLKFTRTKAKQFLPLKQGLSLLEVMLAILIVGISVTSILSLQGVLSRVVFTAHAIVDRAPWIASFFVEADKDKLYQEEKEHKKTVEVPKLTMVYSAVKPTSKVLKGYKHLMIDQIQAQWPTAFGIHKETISMLRFVPKVEKKK